MKKELFKLALESAVNHNVDLIRHWSKGGYDMKKIIRTDVVYYRGLLTGLVITGQLTNREQSDIEHLIVESLENDKYLDLRGVFNE